MRMMQDDPVSFRCPDVLRERLQQYAAKNGLHLSQVIRLACVILIDAVDNRAVEPAPRSDN
jgi:antitoxin component of RelBE/YafQ-DinJ toxin-antitoxin module